MNKNPISRFPEILHSKSLDIPCPMPVYKYLNKIKLIKNKGRFFSFSFPNERKQTNMLVARFTKKFNTPTTLIMAKNTINALPIMLDSKSKKICFFSFVMLFALDSAKNSKIKFCNKLSSI